MNPNLYLFIMSNFYLIVSSLLLCFLSPRFFGIYVNSDSFLKTQLICIFSHLIFCAFYMASRDRMILFLGVSKIGNIFFSVSRVACLYSITLILLYIIYKYSGELYTLRNDRLQVYSFFNEFINKQFKVDLLTYLSLTIFFVANLFYASKLTRYMSFVPLILLIFLEFLQGGRTLSLKILMFVFLVYLIKQGSDHIRRWSLALIMLVAVGFLQRNTNSNGFDLVGLAIAMGEFINTRLTIDLVYPFMGDGNILHQFSFSILGVFPSFFRTELIDYKPTFEIVNELNPLGYGLASSTISDAVYFYGDFFFIYVIVMCLIVNFAYKFLLSGNAAKLLMILVLIINIQGFFRTSFFDYFFVYIYTVAVYMLPFIGAGILKKIFFVRAT